MEVDASDAKTDALQRENEALRCQVRLSLSFSPTFHRNGTLFNRWQYWIFFGSWL